MPFEEEPFVPSTMTLNVASGLVWAPFRSEGATSASAFWPLVPATPATGRASARAAAATTELLPPRRPHRALERDSLFEPLPQSALDRVPLEQARSLRIYRCSFLPRTWRGPQIKNR